MPPRNRATILAPAPSSPATSSGVPSRTSAASTSAKAGRQLQLGARGYLLLAVLLEVAAIAGLRHLFRNHHGG